MVTKEIKVLNDKQFIVHKSDENLMIQKVGTQEVYSEAWDTTASLFEYVETDEPIAVKEYTEGESEMISRTLRNVNGERD